MDKKPGEEPQDGQKTEGVWERKTQDRRWGQNQLFGSVRIGTVAQGTSHGDPTDSALAAIASILERPASRPLGRPPAPPPPPVVDEKAVTPPPFTDTTPNPESFQFSAEKAISASSPPTPAPPVLAEPPPAAPPVVAPAEPPAPPADSDVYVKVGPGPLEAIRFKWSTRAAANGSYFVDETIGTTSRPRTSGPMSKEAAIQFIDACEADAWRRFNALKNEMTGLGSTAVQPPPLPGEGEK